MFIVFGRDISLILQTREISLCKNNSHDLHRVITHSLVHVYTLLYVWSYYWCLSHCSPCSCFPCCCSCSICCYSSSCYFSCCYCCYSFVLCIFLLVLLLLLILVMTHAVHPSMNHVHIYSLSYHMFFFVRSSYYFPWFHYTLLHFSLLLLLVLMHALLIVIIMFLYLSLLPIYNMSSKLCLQIIRKCPSSNVCQTLDSFSIHMRGILSFWGS